MNLNLDFPLKSHIIHSHSDYIILNSSMKFHQEDADKFTWKFNNGLLSSKISHNSVQKIYSFL